MNPDIRIIHDLAQSAPFNMAADMYLLGTAGESETVFLRFYTWADPAITLGCTQKGIGEVLDLAAMRRDGIEWIRRPTGGRAVLHRGDLTYSVVFGKQINIMGRSIAESYRIISDALITGLASAGITCTPHDSVLDADLIRREQKLPCFLAPNRDEIMVNGRKLIGSAQKRTARAVLQHGSIPLTPAFRDLSGYGANSAEQRDAQRRLFESKCTCVAECLPGLATGDLVDALEHGFATALGLPPVRQQWSNEELAAINALIATPAFITGHLS